MPYVIGLTGGIGCGKSTVAELFAQLGAGIIDTDRISHSLTVPGAKALNAIAKEFGPEYIATDGSLDRGALRRLVFSNPDAKSRLEAILHPLIKQEAHRELESRPEPYVLLVVPLLLETGHYRDVVKRVLVVDCDERLQLERTIARNALSHADALAIMSAQLPRKTRLAQADDILHNDGSLDDLRPQIDRLHRKYLQLAQSQT